MTLTNAFARVLMGALGVATPDPATLQKPHARMEDVRIRESSGLAKSSRVEGRYWTHNDSGGSAQIFALDADGRALSGPVQIEGATNRDWEDIASDGQGRLWIGDMSNNANLRRDLCVYVVEEPGEVIPESLPVLRTLRLRFPDQASFPPEKLNFDCEALFVDRGKLFVLTKHRADAHTRLYRLDDTGGDAEQVLTFVEQLDFVGQVTAADLHPDGCRLAVLTYDGVWIFTRKDETSAFGKGRRLRWRLPPWALKQSEGLVWMDQDRLLISNEESALFIGSLRDFEDTAPAPAPAPPKP